MDRLTIDGVDHVALLVHDIDRSLPHYTGTLGFSVVSDESLPALGVRLLFLAAGNTMLQLVQPTAPGPLRDDLERQGEGLHHICFIVEDIEGAARTLAPDNEARIATGSGGRRTTFLPRGQDGLLTELVEIKRA